MVSHQPFLTQLVLIFFGGRPEWNKKMYINLYWVFFPGKGIPFCSSKTALPRGGLPIKCVSIFFIKSSIDIPQKFMINFMERFTRQPRGICTGTLAFPYTGKDNPLAHFMMKIKIPQAVRGRSFVSRGQSFSANEEKTFEKSILIWILFIHNTRACSME